MKLPISLIVLTYNEEANLDDCLKSVRGWVETIFVVDSNSTDRTLEIAEKHGAEITAHPFKNQADQFNWALENLDVKSDWILRLDADERMTEGLWKGIAEKFKEIPDGINGFYFKRKVYFMGRWIKHGGYYPVWFLRLFRRGYGESEERVMDEHVVLTEGMAEKIPFDFIHDDRKENLTVWTEKHNKYSSREVETVVKTSWESDSKNLSGQAKTKRWIKENIYYRLPLFVRPTVYFLYRYFLLLGFLDGKEGLIFHFLHAFWYRFLIDAKIYEYRKRSFRHGQKA